MLSTLLQCCIVVTVIAMLSLLLLLYISLSKCKLDLYGTPLENFLTFLEYLQIVCRL